MGAGGRLVVMGAGGRLVVMGVGWACREGVPLKYWLDKLLLLLGRPEVGSWAVEGREGGGWAGLPGSWVGLLGDWVGLPGSWAGLLGSWVGLLGFLALCD